MKNSKSLKKKGNGFKSVQCYFDCEFLPQTGSSGPLFIRQNGWEVNLEGLEHNCFITAQCSMNSRRRAQIAEAQSRDPGITKKKAKNLVQREKIG